MRAEELMIGDWVINTTYNTNEKVVLLNDDFVDTDSSDDIKLDDIYPIPLTPEILKKNGFKKELEFWNDNFGFPFFIREEKDEYDLIILSWEGEDTAVLSIKYVHELQHALRLCGIEKEIEL